MGKFSGVTGSVVYISQPVEFLISGGRTFLVNGMPKGSSRQSSAMIHGGAYLDDILVCGLALHRLRDIHHGAVLLHRDHLDGQGYRLSRENGGVQNFSVLSEEADIPGSRGLVSVLEQ